MRQDIANLRFDIQQHYVTHEELTVWTDKVKLHQIILFTTIGVICLSVIGALVALVVGRG